MKMYFRKTFSALVGAVFFALAGGIFAGLIGAAGFLPAAAMLAGGAIGAYLGWKRPGAPKEKGLNEGRTYTAGRSSRRGPDPHGRDASVQQAGLGDIHDRPSE